MQQKQEIVIIIGGGAAGFFCAVNAARLNPSLKVILLERSGKLLTKVKVSGGGRCNVTQRCFEIPEMAKRYPRGQHFVKKVFHRFFTTHTIQWFKDRGVELKTEHDGRMFPVTNSSQTIIDCFLKEATQYGVEIHMNTDVKIISIRDGLFNLTTSSGKIFTADKVCVATGGAPKEEMFNWLTTLGHTSIKPVPSLFTFNLSKHPITSLMGVSATDVVVKISGTKLLQRGPVLITHWGLSGPCILRLSAWGARELADRNWKFDISINWLPGFNELQLRDELQRIRFDLAAQRIHHKNPFALPKRLWEFILQQSEIDQETRWADLAVRLQNMLIRNLLNYQCSVNGKTTFKEEFVTAGGIRLSEIDPTTMMSKKLPNLYFAGEVIDVDGITGGYNFQNAWSSGFTAAASIAG